MQPHTYMKTHSKALQLLICTVLALSMLMTEVYALEVPVSQTENMIDGRQTLIQVYEVAPDTDPKTLIQDEIIQNGYRYTMTSITKETVVVEDEQEITQEYEVTINVSDEDDARLEALMSMPAFIDYDVEGYTGKLYPVIASLTGTETGRTNHSGYKTITKSYTYDYNDDSLVPGTSDGYTLSSISWAEGAYIEDTSIPENYIATATYRKAYSYSTIDGWSFTMSYVGDVTLEHEDVIRYKLIYTGVLIEEPKEPTFWERLFGSAAGQSGDTNAGTGLPVGTIIGVLCAVLAVAALSYGSFVFVRGLRNNKVSVYARDDMSGEYTPLKPVWFRDKDSSISIDPLSAPAATDFRVSIRPALAAQLKGKVVTLRAGQNVVKHQIGDAGGTDYTIDISVDR